jgi:S-adenosylmethionine-diacylgycerolhomoserine-N-methlytransferase
MTVDSAAHMDNIYRRQTPIYDLTRRYFLLGRDRLLADLQPPEGGSILEIACGTGRNLILAARRHPGAQCYGFDISPVMLGAARASVAQSGMSERIFLAEGDATAFDAEALFGRKEFDRIAISYAVSMIPGWRHALARAAGCLAPGGRLHVVDFGQQEQWPGVFRRVLSAWLRKFDVSPRFDLDDELMRLARAQAMALTFEKLYGGYAYYGTIQAPPKL